MKPIKLGKEVIEIKLENKWKPSGGLHLPEDHFYCEDCQNDWLAEYDFDEEIICNKCKSKNVKEI